MSQFVTRRLVWFSVVARPQGKPTSMRFCVELVSGCVNVCVCVRCNLTAGMNP